MSFQDTAQAQTEVSQDMLAPTPPPQGAGRGKNMQLFRRHRKPVKDERDLVSHARAHRLYLQGACKRVSAGAKDKLNAAVVDMMHKIMEKAFVLADHRRKPGGGGVKLDARDAARAIMHVQNDGCNVQNVYVAGKNARK